MSKREMTSDDYPGLARIDSGHTYVLGVRLPKLVGEQMPGKGHVSLWFSEEIWVVIGG